MYLEKWDEFKEHAEKKGNIDEIRAKYEEIDEDFTECMFDEWDEMGCQSSWNAIGNEGQTEILEYLKQDFPEFHATLTGGDDDEEEAQGPTPEQLAAIERWKDEQRRREEMMKARILHEKKKKAY